LIEFDFFPYQVLKLFGDYVHGVSLDLKLVEYLQLFEFAHFIQCTSLVDDCTAEISFLIGISKELAASVLIVMAHYIDDSFSVILNKFRHVLVPTDIYHASNQLLRSGFRNETIIKYQKFMFSMNNSQA